jgi:hypothetical protein
MGLLENNNNKKFARGVRIKVIAGISRKKLLTGKQRSSKFNDKKPDPRMLG